MDTNATLSDLYSEQEFGDFDFMDVVGHSGDAFRSMSEADHTTSGEAAG
jgi:hypothetical protein